MNAIDMYDVTIIGGGPAGLYSAFYSGVREMKTKIIEYQPTLGGKVQLYPEKIIWDVGGLPPTSGEKFMEQLIIQGLTFKPTVKLNTKVTSISKSVDGTFRVHTNKGEVHLSKTVIVAVGGGIITPQRLDIKGAERFEVTNLHYTIQSLKRFKGKSVLISGGGNAAIDWANELEPIAKKVYITYRKGALKGHESEVSKLLNSSVQCFFHTSISKLTANRDQDMIEHVELCHENSGETITLKVDDLIINHGYERDTALLKNHSLKVTLEDDHFIAGAANSTSSVEGLYAAGDILKHDGKLHLIAGAFQDAANAVNQAKRFIEPDAKKTGMVSSHNDLFKERNKELITNHV
ncbi:NAD(P)/FAD-dependent oxidoreductase [Alteribacter populi]|uniref:NAD(P)/FAD-dependent oxidoreductase n=1 Tax=Alteribacter populi TaxID=2011011 RepID=UPI000BBB2DA7|nr:NAD(P)/FAD-dependent oxidoreductase [Alteribacter populi]